VTTQADTTGNAARLRRAIDDWNRGGLRALSDGWWAEDIAWHDLPDLPDPVVAQGRASVEARVEEMIAAVGQWQFVTREVEERGELTLAHLELAGHGVLSGAGFTGSIHQIHRWRDGRVIEVLTFADRDQALTAMHGLSPAGL
jgi:ketosteroid isomerase-like protein